MEPIVERNFIPGSQWLYYKIYSGSKTTDVILSEIVKPLTESLLEQRMIDRWFFIRYKDPKHHLRLRFHCCQPSGVGQIINTLLPALTSFVNDDRIWKVQLDTYHREIERYGTDTIELAEEIFFRDSVMITGVVSLIEGEEGEELRWLFALRAIDHFLDQFQYDMQEKMELLKIMKTGFAKEFGVKRPLKNQINKRYNQYRNRIAEFMDYNEENQPDYAPLFQLLEEKAVGLTPVVPQLLKRGNLTNGNDRMNDLLSSFIHMLMNRLFKSKNRQHELICYDFLFRYYMAVISRARNAKD